MISKTTLLPILGISLSLLTGCDKIDQLAKDPKLRITYACHGDRRIRQSDGTTTTEKVAHSITFAREAIETPGPKPRIKYKVNAYILDHDFQDLTRNDLLPKDILEKVQKREDFAVYQQYGVFQVFSSKRSNPDMKVGTNSDSILRFNFITETLTVDVTSNIGLELGERISDRTKCQQVTDPKILRELSV